MNTNDIIQEAAEAWLELELLKCDKPKEYYSKGVLNDVTNSYNRHCTHFLTHAKEKHGAELVKVDKWISVKDRLPICFESGNWDGLRSEFMLVELKDGSYDIARLYKGVLDGNEFADWYDKVDFDFTSPVIKWKPITT
jgi:hypothetical protein